MSLQREVADRPAGLGGPRAGKRISPVGRTEALGFLVNMAAAALLWTEIDSIPPPLPLPYIHSSSSSRSSRGSLSLRPGAPIIGSVRGLTRSSGGCWAGPPVGTAGPRRSHCGDPRRGGRQIEKTGRRAGLPTGGSTKQTSSFLFMSPRLIILTLLTVHVTMLKHVNTNC